MSSKKVSSASTDQNLIFLEGELRTKTGCESDVDGMGTEVAERAPTREIPTHPHVFVLRHTQDHDAYRKAFDELRWTIENEVIWLRRYNPNIGCERIPDFIVDRLGLHDVPVSLVIKVIQDVDGLGPEASPAKRREIGHRARAVRLESHVVPR